MTSLAKSRSRKGLDILEPVVLKLEFVIAAVALMTAGCTAGKSATLPRPDHPSLSSEAAGEPRMAANGNPTACRLRLTPDRAVFEPLGTIAGAGECGGPDIVVLKGVITKDRLSVEIAPAATLRCEMAEAIVDWVREDLVGQAMDLGPVVKIETLDSFECRGQNRVIGAKLSEHGRANALDISAIRLKSGRLVQPTDSAVSKDFRVAIRTSVCARFTTVLGPGADGYHEDHIHVDLAERRGGYRICQWDIRDLLPDADYAQQLAAGAIPLPRPRPLLLAKCEPIRVRRKGPRDVVQRVAVYSYSRACLDRSPGVGDALVVEVQLSGISAANCCRPEDNRPVPGLDPACVRRCP
jgi:hypothetical protein